MTTLKSVAIAAGLASSAFGQATSPVVGYETITLNAGINPVGIRLLEKPVVTGQLETIGEAGVTDADVDFSTLLDPEVTYILEIEDAVGILQIITQFSGGTLTTDEDLSGAVADGTSYTLREASTIASVFGADNSAGLTSTTGADSSDQILVSNGIGGFDTYFFFDNGGTPALVLVDETSEFGIVPAVPEDIILPNDQGILIVSPVANSLVVAGDLKTTPTSVPLSPGINAVSSQFPVSQTIESVFGADNSAGLTSTTGADSSDQILVSDGNGGFDTYFFFDNEGTPALVLVDETSAFGIVQATAADVELGSGYLVVSPGSNNFTHSAPQIIVNAD